MTGYQPASRRPIADGFRRTAHAAVRWCVRHGVHPNAVSYTSVVAAAGAGVCFWQAGGVPELLIPAVGLCYVRLWCNMLDGMVALASGKASPVGEIVNELPDRVSDIVIFIGVGHSGLCHPLAAYWVVVFALLTAYVGTLGQAVGAGREFRGVMAKPWRMVALHVGAWVTLALLWSGYDIPRADALTPLDWTLFAIIAGCAQTIGVRLAAMVRTLRARRPNAED